MDRDLDKQNEEELFESKDNEDIEMDEEEEVPLGQFNLCGDIVQLYEVDQQVEMEEQSELESSFEYMRNQHNHRDNPFSLIVNFDFDVRPEENDRNSDRNQSHLKPSQSYDDFNLKSLKKKKKEDELAEIETCASVSEIDKDEEMESEEDPLNPSIKNGQEETKHYSNHSLSSHSCKIESTCDDENYEQCRFSEFSIDSEECDEDIQDEGEELIEYASYKNSAQTICRFDSDQAKSTSPELHHKSLMESMSKEREDFMKMVENYDSKSSNMNSKEYYFLNNCDQQSEFSQNYMNELVNEHERTHFNLINMSGCLLSDEIIGCPSNKILLSDKINE